jgi:hypothetical protein
MPASPLCCEPPTPVSQVGGAPDGYLPAVDVLSKRLKTFAKCVACVATFLALGYASQLTDDLSSSFAHLPGVRAAGPSSVVVVPQRLNPDGTERDPATARKEDADSAAPGTAVNEPTIDPPASEPPPASTNPDTLRPVYPSGYVVGGEVTVAVPSSPATLATTLERQVASLSAGACRDFSPWRPVDAVNVIPDGSCATGP